jgi:tetratricopeptide (TPR) repeat protein
MCSQIDHGPNRRDLLDVGENLYHLGRDLMEAGHSENAIAVLEASVKIQPHFKTFELLGECLLQLGRLEDAIAPLAAATTLNTQTRAPTLLAEVYLGLGEMERAKRMASLAVERNPSYRRAKEILQRIRDMEDRPEE